ncbi:unnamed protein product [Discosporangium mesarthrocarpum]
MRSANTVGGTVMSAKDDGEKILVSGLLDSTDRADQLVFDVLQAQGKWDKIVAFSDSMAAAKKRLTSRKSRYTGLLDILEFEEGDRSDAAEMAKKLEGCTAWLCFNCEGKIIPDQVDAAKSAGVKSMVVTSSIPADEVANLGVVRKLKGSGMEFTFIRVGEVIDGKEGGPMQVGTLTSELHMEQVVRDDLIRLSAEAFMMGNTTNRAFSFGVGDKYASEFLEELRRKGLTRRDEMSAVLSGGLEEFRWKRSEEEREKKYAELGPSKKLQKVRKKFDREFKTKIAYKYESMLLVDRMLYKQNLQEEADKIVQDLVLRIPYVHQKVVEGAAKFAYANQKVPEEYKISDKIIQKVMDRYKLQQQSNYIKAIMGSFKTRALILAKAKENVAMGRRLMIRERFENLSSVEEGNEDTGLMNDAEFDELMSKDLEESPIPPVTQDSE